MSGNNITSYGAKNLAESIQKGALPHLKYLDVSGNQITPTGEGYFVNSLASLKTQDMVVILRKITATGNEVMQSALNFILKGLRYVFEQHDREQGKMEEAILAVYGKNPCIKGLAEAFQGISVEIIKNNAKYPIAVKLADKLPNKIAGKVGIVIMAVKDNWEDLANVDMFHCIAIVNDALGFGQPDIEEYTKSLSGDNHD